MPAAGLYAITWQAPEQADHDLLGAVEQAIQGGTALIQYRDKHASDARRHARATALLALCRRHGVPLIINDDLALAVAIGADGLHVGRDDPDIANARRALGPHAIIGASCYNRLELAEAAVAAGASYVAFGRFFPSLSKPAAVQAEPDLLVRAHRHLPVPVVAIGGITPENGGRLLHAGADLLAVIEGLFAAPDVRGAAARYRALFDDPRR